MLQTRKLRIVVLAVIALLVIILVVSRRDTYTEAVAEATPKKQGSTLFESANNAKEDAAINKEISKQKDNEDTPATEELAKKAEAEKPAKPASTTPFDPAQEFIQTRALSPMTVFLKTYCPFSKRLKKLLSDNYVITPQPTIVELDKHEHGKEFQEYLSKITERSTVPNVLVGQSHVSKGGCDDIVKLHEEGKLLDLLVAWGDKKISVERIQVPLNA